LTATLQEELSGVEKASILLVSLGLKTGSEVLRYLSLAEVQSICVHISKMDAVTRDALDTVLRELDSGRKNQLPAGGVGFARQLLELGLGEERAQQMLDDIASGTEVRPFGWLTQSSVDRLTGCIAGERPQTIAMVLAYLPMIMAADAISRLPEEIQGDVALRLSSMRPVDRASVQIIEAMLGAKLRTEETGETTAVGGMNSLVAVLNNSDRSTEKRILEYLDATEPDLAQSVKQQMFTFEDVLKLDRRAIQSLIRELEPDVLRLSMKGASTEIRDMFFMNMSERAATSLREELDLMGAVRRKDVEAAQKEIALVLRHLEEIGEINLRSKDDEMIA
jgi:flagellar motor switch protein FliG